MENTIEIKTEMEKIEEACLNNIFEVKTVTDKNGNEKKSVTINIAPFVNAAIMIFHPVTFNDMLYLYDSSTGLYYLDRSGNTIKGWVDKMYTRARIDPVIGLPASKRSDQDKQSVYSAVKVFNVTASDISPFNTYKGIPVQNGVVIFDSKTGDAELIDYTPEMKFTRKIPTRYNPDADYSRMREIILTWVPPEYIQALIQIPAQALIQRLYQNIRKAYLLLGDKRGGKSTYTKLLQNVFGRDNCSQVPLQDIDKGFNKAEFDGKFFNTVEELPRMTVDSAAGFMSFVSNSNQIVEQKYQIPYSTKITAVHVYCTNNPPPLTKDVLGLSAWWDRWILIPFPREYENVVNWEQENFTEANYEAFLKMAIIGAGQIIANGYKLPFMQDAEYVADIWTNSSDPLRIFIYDNMEFNHDYSVAKTELVSAVKAYSQTLTDEFERAQLPSTPTALTQRLKAYGIFPVRERQPTADEPDRRVPMYKGLRPSQFSPYF